MKKLAFMRLFLLALLLWMILPSATSGAEPVITWKVYSPLFAGTWENKTAQIWMDDIVRMSGGRIKINFIAAVPGETFPDLHPHVQNGDIDAAYTWPGIVAGKYPAAALFAGTPAFFDLMGYFTWMHAYGGKELWQESYGNTLKVFPAGLCRPKVGAWTNKKLDAMDDFKGLRYRTSDRAWHRGGDSIWRQILSEVGASPIKDPYGPSVMAGMVRGTLDAAEALSLWMDMTLGFQRVSKYCYFPGIQESAGFLELIINNEKWNALPQDLKDIVRGACDTAIAKSLTQWALDDAKVLKMLKDQGKVQSIKFSGVIQQEILDRFMAHYDAVKDSMFQKVWKSQKEFMKIYLPYMRLQQADADVKLK